MADPAAARLAAARDLVPTIAAAAEGIDRERRLPASLVSALVEAGLFRLLAPASLGGGEVDLLTFARLIETVAAADASTAWCLGQANGIALIASRQDPAGAREIFGDPGTIVAWGPGPGTATVVEGGYRLTGHWSFASGCRHATWLGGMASVVGPDGAPRRLADGSPEVRALLFRSDGVELRDIWRVSGLRGTASDGYAVTDRFVPARHAPSWLDPRREAGRLYAFTSNNVFATAFSSVALGIARAAIDAFVALAAEKTPRGRPGVLRENAVVQSGVARAEALLRSGRAFLHESVRDAWAEAGPTDTLPLARRATIRLAGTHAIHAAAQAVDLVYHAAGATAIFDSNPFERRFRDIHAVTQQIQGSQAHFETVGRYLLGLDPESAFL